MRINSESLRINLKSDIQFFGKDQKIVNDLLILKSCLVHMCVCVCVCVYVCARVCV